MKNVHNPRLFVIIFAILLVLAFLVGTTLAFKDAQAAPTASVTTPLATLATISPTPTHVTQAASANMTGIIILGILLVAIIAIGLLWGGRVTNK